MSEPQEPRKISVDELTERALKWWSTELPGAVVETIVVREYMKKHNITDTEVEW